MRTNPQVMRFSWALYDLANTIFSMNIVSFYFVLWLTVDKRCPEIYYSLALNSSILAAALLMPLVGELSDRLRKRLPLLIAFTAGCVMFTCLLGFTRNIYPALILFALANLCYQLGGLIYNALLPQISADKAIGRTSGLGVSLGYVGTILGLLLVKPFFDAGGRQATFIPTACLFLAFAWPSFIFIKDPPHAHIFSLKIGPGSIFSRLSESLHQVRQNPALRQFLIAIFLCLNAVNTIVVYMGVYASRVFGFADSQLIYFMVISTLFAIAGSYAFGRLTDWQGSRKSLNLAIKLWCLAIFLAAIAVRKWMFWVSGPLTGICLGATWVCLRTMLIELIDVEKIGQMFGLLGLVQMLSYFLGTTVWGLITTWLFPGWGELKYRIAIGSLFLFMFCGYRLLQRVADLKTS